MAAVLQKVLDRGSLPLLALGLALLTPLASLELFAFGFYERPEPSIVWLHLASAVGTVALLANRRHPALPHALRHPFVLIPAGLGLWTCLAAAHAAFPLLSIGGYYETGQGGLWYFDLAVLTACALLVAPRPVAWRVLTLLAVAVAAAIAAIKFAAWLRGDWALLYISSFYAYIPLALPLLLLRGPEDRRRRAVAGALLLAAGALLAMSENRAAMLLAALAGAAYLAVGLLRRRRPAMAAWPSPGWSLAAILAAGILPYVLVRWFEPVQRVASLRSRSLLLDLMQLAQPTDAGALLLGSGWGHVKDAMFRFATSQGQNPWADPSSPDHWDFLLRDYIHSHNWLTETLYSVGIPGLLLFLALHLSIPLACDGRRRLEATLFAGMLLALDGVWIQMPASLPFLALALGALAAPERRLPIPAPRATVVLPVLAAILTLQIGFALAQYRFGTAVTRTMAAYAESPAPAQYDSFPADFRGSDLIAAVALRQVQEREAQALARDDGPESRARARAVLDRVHRDLAARMPETTVARFALTALTYYGNLAFVDSLTWLRNERLIDIREWGAWARRMLALAPERTDTIHPYLAWCLLHGLHGEVEMLTGAILQADPADAVALYYRGALLMQSNDPVRKEEGRSFIRRSLDNGAGRLLSLPKSVEDAVGYRRQGG